MLAGLRSALFVLFMTVMVVPIAIVSLVYSIFVRGERLYWMCMSFLKVSIWGAKTICGVRWRIQGMEHLPTGDRGAAVILTPKHQSTWETFAFPALLPRPLAYVFKRELLYIPFFGWAMARLDMIHIDRSRRSEAWSKVLQQGRRLMGQGLWVIMFPEGTRAARGEQGVYKSGAARLSIETGVPMVPIAVTSARCWPRRSFVLKPGVIDISIGAPIAPEPGVRPEALMQRVEQWVEAEMRRLDPDAYRP